jgi:hypothetical protein
MLRTILLAILFFIPAGSFFHCETEAATEASRTPRIDKIVPNTLDACSLQAGRKIAVLGEFPAGMRLLIDGAGITTEKAGEGEIIFTLPLLKGGLHQVAVVGPGNRVSLPEALFIDTVPKITGVSQGADRVTSYEVVVRGENFLFDSALVVNDVALRPARTEEPNSLPPIGDKDHVRYEDCSTLVYIRHPVTREPQSVTMRVVNPGGEQSPAYVVEIP